MTQRYQRNQDIISKDQQAILAKKKVAVVGCGGLGGFVIEELARLGVGHLVLIDGDKFEETNLNRQLFSSEDNLGEHKAIATKIQLESINSMIKITANPCFFNKINGQTLLAGCDLVMDCMDSVVGRFDLAEICDIMKLTHVHGAIAGWRGQVGLIEANKHLMSKIYSTTQTPSKNFGSPIFTVAATASIQVAEAIKYLLGNEQGLRNKLLYADFLNYDFVVIDLMDA